MKSIIDLRPGDKILVSRTDKLGDLVLALPFIETLKRRYPDCRVDVAASLYASPILENNPSIDGIVRVQNDQLAENRLYRRDMRHNLRMAKYSAVVVLYPERLISRLYYKAGIQHRIGTSGRFHSVFFNHRLAHSRKANQKHESEYNLDFLKFFDNGPIVHRPTVHPTEKEIRNARRLLQENGISGAFVILHPGSGGSAENWALNRFIMLNEQLAYIGISAILTGSDEEGEQIKRYAAAKGTRVNLMAGKTDLRTLAAVLSLASVVVANSTGPLHLAVAVGTRGVGLYPSRKIMSPRRWGPLGDGHRVIQPQSDDCHCPAKNCSCMETISVDVVTSAVREVFQLATI